MRLDFIKMHGAGNDFVMVNNLSGEIELASGQVRLLCDRHRGIGADGVILVSPSERPECAAFMDYRNSDGTLAEMCGNGVRCFAKYLVDHGLVSAQAGGEGRFVAHTRAGSRPVSFTVNSEGLLLSATVDMGTPAFDPADIPTTLASNAQAGGSPAVVASMAVTSFGEFRLTCVSMGNPHAVLFVDDVCPDEAERFAADPSGFPVEQLGRQLESCTELFPRKANIEFVAVMPDSQDAAGAAGADAGADGGGGHASAHLRMRVYERGVGETLACGTGACAAAVASALTGRTGRSCVVHLPGGELLVEWRDDGHVLMTGPATSVYSGTIEL
ncbi:MAG: diaminopimelate epimerase [Coriobacteriales bacterium]|jgi:diaminopimelate epimerase|nr:diaminopimelate epimerase [Coriobacteriales bacterium]